MTDAFRPRLSVANRILPLLRERIVDRSMAHPLPKGLSIGLVPIVEEGLFGFELETDRETHTYLIIGCNAHGAPVIRETMYDTQAPRALQLVATHGQRLSRPDREARFHAQRHDSQFNDWPDAVEALWNRLSMLFPGHPRQRVAIPDAQKPIARGSAVGRLDTSGALGSLHHVLWPARRGGAGICFRGRDRRTRGIDLSATGHLDAPLEIASRRSLRILVGGAAGH